MHHQREVKIELRIKYYELKLKHIGYIDESFIIGSIIFHADFKTAVFKLWVTEWGKAKCENL